MPTGDYSVVVTDANGCTAMASVSVVSGIGEIAVLDAFSISPNPASGLLSVKMALSSIENVEVNILDVTGRVVASAADNTSGREFRFDLSNRPSGVYLVKLTVGGNTLARRLVLAR
ncbi:MAG: T9SS type A sorting domain-containing protein [Saprospiraceae bacterium]|nr:T9SS type A sorting domain-containing protein [Saprospiraceae bacterium]